MELSEEAARRRQQRLGEEGGSENFRPGQGGTRRRWNQRQRSDQWRIFQFLSGGSRRLTLIGFFPGGNRLTKAAGMLAIESLREGFGQGMVFEVVAQHGGPGDQLQAGPRGNQRKHEKKTQPRL